MIVAMRGARLRTGLGVVLAFALLGGACRYDPGVDARPSPPNPSLVAFQRGVAVLETGGGEVRVQVEIAETGEQRQTGLMFRENLAPDAGMVFLVDQPSDGAFWMKNTLVPLSVAFLDADGTIMVILNMEPCPEEPCPLYDPHREWMGALEVNQGFFEEAGVEVGDRVRLER